jgi:hypothetical protein
MHEREAILATLLSVTVTVVGGCRETPERAPSRDQSSDEAASIELGPALDRELAPYTGWTRAHYEAVFARMLLGFVDHRSPAGARTRYPGGEQLPATMEGATRMLPALGAWLACPCNPDRIVVGGRELDVLAIARAIVVAGTDPASPDYWWRSRGGWDQREVEAASVAEFLVRSRARVWDRLTVFEQLRIMAWLRPAERPLAANWLAFQIVRNTARAVLGQPAPSAATSEQLDLLERDYVGDGFYQDGHHGRVDWYNAFIVHAELSFWRRHAGADEPERAARVARRTQTFLGHLPYLFDAAGRIAPIGRSLGYRSAVLASLHASVLADDGFVEPGLARRISAGNLAFHLGAGLFGPDDVLTRGYHGEQPEVIEDYIAPGSQYLFSRALSVLALAPDHEFWTAVEQPLPADLGDFVHAIPAIGWTVEYDADTAGLILHNAGSSTSRPHHHDKYAKLGYPTQTWYAVAGDDRRPYDAAIVSATFGNFDRRRAGPDASAVAPGFSWQRYAVAPERGRGPEHWIATTWLGDPAWVGHGGLRLSCIAPSSDEPARAYQGSYALAVGDSSILRRGRDETGGPWAYLDSGGSDRPRWGSGAVLLAGLVGWDTVGRELDAEPARHVLGGPAAYLGLRADAPFTRLHCFASIEALSADPFDPTPILAAAPTVELVGTRAEIHDWHGTEAWVQLGRAPIQRSVELGPVRAAGPIRLLWTGPYRSNTRRRIVGVGIRQLDSPAGPWLVAHERPLGYVACDIDETHASLHCELDGPAKLRVPPWAHEVRIGAATWTGSERWRSRVSVDEDTEWIDVPSDADEPNAVRVVDID